MWNRSTSQFWLWIVNFREWNKKGKNGQNMLLSVYKHHFCNPWNDLRLFQLRNKNPNSTYLIPEMFSNQSSAFLRRPKKLAQCSSWFWRLRVNVKTMRKITQIFCGRLRKTELYKPAIFLSVYLVNRIGQRILNFVSQIT